MKPTIGHFIPALEALRLATVLEQLCKLAAPGPLRDKAVEAMDAFHAGTVGDFEERPIGPVGEGEERSDLAAYRRGTEDEKRAQLEARRLAKEQQADFIKEEQAMRDFLAGSF